MTYTILGVFKNQDHAQEAVHKLNDLGYDVKDMSIVMKEAGRAKIIGKSKGQEVVEDTAGGAVTGGIIGGLAGLLVGAGTIAIPGAGALLFAGPLSTALGLTGTAAATVSGAAGGALAGGIVGGLVGLGVPEKKARVYEEQINAGGVLLAVPTDEDGAEEVEDVLAANNAYDIQEITLPQAKERDRDRDEHSKMHAAA